ncbi:MAG: class I SAM-dependent methyltransferase [Herpetosiphonaceae bacterium]|nr:class I SAM-dependent methyltransferase [Herpetosiphonaceae bacterium]
MKRHCHGLWLAQATGIDISDVQIGLAIQKATAAGIATHFIAADVYVLPQNVQQGTFDDVYTGGGALAWLPDIRRWAQVVAAALRLGGRLILWEIHPLATCLWVKDKQLQLVGNYFGRSTPSYDHGWSHFGGGEHASEAKVEFCWPIGDVVTAIVQAGLSIELLTEFPADGRDRYRFGDVLDEVGQLPSHFLLIARK